MEFKRKPANYTRYKNRRKWYVKEAIFLILKRNPEEKLKIYAQVKFITPDKDRVTFEDIYHNFKTALELKEIDYMPGAHIYFDGKVEPYDFLVWAKNKQGITIPNELLSILDSRSTTTSNFKRTA